LAGGFVATTFFALDFFTTADDGFFAAADFADADFADADFEDAVLAAPVLEDTDFAVAVLVDGAFGAFREVTLDAWAMLTYSLVTRGWGRDLGKRTSAPEGAGL
jgi:hypothetical protein